MRFDDREINWLADLLKHAGETEIMPRFRRLDRSRIKQKTSTVDLVTEADTAAEALITAALLERYPSGLVVGEEAASADPEVLDGLADADLAFVVDPVDGTFNFASDVPLFGVMLGVVVKGETVAGIIHDPVGKDWIIGSKGGGSYIRTSEDKMFRVQTAPAVPISQMTGSVSWQYLSEPDRSTVARNQALTMSQIGYRCSAHEYRLVASGHAHFIVYNKLMPWDHLAGCLIHSEAGGYSARFDGSAYRPGQLDGGLLVAPDRESWVELRKALWAR